LINKIKSTHFPINFQKKVVKNTILKNIPNRYTCLSVRETLSSIVRSCECFDCYEDIDNIGMFIAQMAATDKVNNIPLVLEKIFEDMADYIADLLISRDGCA
jgi:hypothetical protein